MGFFIWENFISIEKNSTYKNSKKADKIMVAKISQI